MARRQNSGSQQPLGTSPAQSALRKSPTCHSTHTQGVIMKSHLHNLVEEDLSRPTSSSGEVEGWQDYWHFKGKISVP